MDKLYILKNGEDVGKREGEDQDPKQLKPRNHPFSSVHLPTPLLALPSSLEFTLTYIKVYV
jgi:hypothetical protein